MDDLISRQAAIDNLISFLQLDGEYAWGVRECLNALPTVQPEPRWIPVTERLPERYGRFIVTIVPDAGELWKTIEFAMYSDLMGLVKTPVFWKGNVGKSDFEDVTSKVTAWMPLPEPYREETEDVDLH